MNGLVVATFNVRNGRAFDGWNSWPFRRKTLAAAIADLDADVAGLQEVYGFQRRYFERRLPGYEFVGDGRNRNGRGEQCTVLSRLAIEAHATRWFDTPGSRFPRIATTATIRVGEGRVAFTSLHLDETAPDRRRRSVEQLAAWLGDSHGAHVIVGDFNARLHEAATFAPLLDAGFRSAAADATIDHILFGPGVELVDAHVVDARGRWVSDHRPVVARLRVR